MTMPGEKVLLGDSFKTVEMDIMRGGVVKTGQRIDGRDLKDGPPDRLAGPRPAAHARLGAVHPR